MTEKNCKKTEKPDKMIKKKKSGCRHMQKICMKAVALLLAVVIPAVCALPQGMTADADDVTVTTFAELKNAVEAGGTVTLGADITVTDTLTVSGTKTVTILGDGHTLNKDFGSTKNVFDVLSDSTLNLGKEDGSSKLTLKGKHDQTGALVLVSGSGATLNMYDGVTLTDNGYPSAADNAGAVIVQGGGAKFYMYGGTIKDCYQFSGGGVEVSNYGAFFMVDGTIENCHASQDGGGVWISWVGQFYMEGGTIRDCSCGEHGGGVFNDDKGYFVMYGGKIEGCTAGQYGGGFANILDWSGGYSGYYVCLSSGIITHNTSSFGGGVYIDQPLFADAEISGTVIANNHARVVTDGGIHLGYEEYEKCGGSDICLGKNTSIALPDAAAMDQVYEDDGKTPHGRITGWFEDSREKKDVKDSAGNKIIESTGKKRFLDKDKNINGSEKITDSVISSGSDFKFLIAAYDYDYTLRYDANAGSDAVTGMPSPSAVIETSFNDESADFTVSDAEPERNGYTFEGWADTPSAGAAEYRSGDTVKVSSSAALGAEKTIYAVWISDEEAEKKYETPSIRKKVWNAEDQKWRKTASAGISDKENELVFKIRGTLPERLNASKTVTEGGVSKKKETFSSYKTYTITDTYPEGITPEGVNDDLKDNLKVYLYDSGSGMGKKDKDPADGAEDITELFDVSADTSARTITVKLKDSGVTATGDTEAGAVDLRKKYKIGDSVVSFDKDSKIIVRFTAKLNKDAVKGPEGNENKAVLEYSRSDKAAAGSEEKTGKTGKSISRVFTFGLNVIKYKEKTKSGNELEGAEFKLYKGTGKEDTDLIAKGTSDENGIVRFGGSEEFSVAGGKTAEGGKYTLVETKAPDGYHRVADAEFAITADTEDIGDDLKLSADKITFTSSKTDGEDAFKTDDEKAEITGKFADKAGEVLPDTGGPGRGIIYIAGSLLIAAGAVTIVFRSKKNIKRQNKHAVVRQPEESPGK